MATGFVPELNMENQMDKQMGCMTGLLQIFDRHQILSGKRLHSTKRLLPPPVVDTVLESVVSVEALPVHSRKSGKPKQQVLPTPERMKQWFPPAELPLKLSKETPRLSLDSRATADEKGGLHLKEIRSSAAIRPPSNGVAIDTQVYGSHNLIAKLMGLEPMRNSLNTSESEKKPELRRSSSESGVSRGFLHSRFIMESNNFPVKQKNQSHTPIVGHEVLNSAATKNSSINDYNGVNLSPWKAAQHAKSFFDSVDNLPEPKQNVSAQGEIKKRLKMRGIEEPTKDLETLKNILESLKLKGLLHSTKPAERNPHTRHQKFVYDESPIVVMKPSRSSITPPIHRRMENEYPPENGRSPERQFRRNYSFPVENSPPQIPQRARRPNLLVKPKPLSSETQRRANELTDNRRVLPALPPKLHARITGSDPMTNSRPPRSKKATGKDDQKANNSGEDESASISGSSLSTSTDTERSRTEGRTLLERCDKLLHSIAEMTAAADMQPSPVSVLDSSLYRDGSFTPSPITSKRKIHFKDRYGSAEEETWSTGVSPISEETPEELDFLYISDIISAFNVFPGESDLFLFLEKQQFQKGQDSSKASRLQRKAVFDTITELLKSIRRLPPWKSVHWTTDDDVTRPSLDKVWLEFQRIRDPGDAEDMHDIICGLLKKDFTGDEITGWKDFPTEMSETILDLERLIFKDLIGETLRDLAALASENRLSRMSPKKVLWK
ncbi:uncharacterized protein LOC142543667 [Primulina tabacum]|uniref:uncharacterized protein LOC142543667 n=1 Tax=Primulina tabacum TaxID=48773 RepID=UPI003F5A8771